MTPVPPTAPRPADPEALRARLLELLEDQLGWRPALDGAGSPDVGADLIRAFLRLVDVVAEHVNAVPEHRLLAFLDLLGVSARPPSAARCPLVLTLAPGAPEGALVPEGTQVAARPRPGEADPPVFATLTPLYATASALAAVLVDEPARDRFTLKTGTDPLTLFHGEVRRPRRLLVADPVLALALPKDVTLEVATRGATGWLRRVSWEWRVPGGWSAEGLPAPLHEEVAGSVRVTFPGLGSLTPPGDEATAGPALRGTLQLPVVAATAAHERGETAAADVPCEAAATGASPTGDVRTLDVTRPFRPFVRPVVGAWFALACEDAFGNPDAEVRLAVAADPPSDPAGAGAHRPPVLHWAHSTVSGWEPLDVRGWQDGVAAEPGRVLLEGGTLTLEPPVGWAPRDVGGRSYRWLRAELLDPGDAADPTGAQPDAAPTVQRLQVGYRWPLPVVHDVRVVATVAPRTETILDAARSNADAVDLSTDFLPFGPHPRLNATFAMSAGVAFTTPGLRVTLLVEPTSPVPEVDPAGPDVRPPPARPSDDVRIVVEYHSQRLGRWSEVVPHSDTTRALSVTGRLELTVPTDAGPCAVAGDLRSWVRLRLAGGDYGSEATISADEDGTPVVVPATLAPPVLRKVGVLVEGVLDRGPAQTVRVQNGDDEVDLRTGPPDATVFPPPAEPGATLELGFEGSFGDRPVSLLLDVAVPPRGRRGLASADGPVVLAWERYDPDDRTWTRMALDDGTYGLSRPGVVTFLPPADLVARRRWGRELTWLRVRRLTGRYPEIPVLRAAALNAVVAEAAVPEREVVGSGDGCPGQVLACTHRPVLAGVGVEVEERGTWRPWEVVDSFDESGPQDAHAVVDPLAGLVRFGDGRRGRVPPARAAVRATYRRGGGASSNRDADQVTELVSSVPFVVGVTNPLPASGGHDAEGAGSVRRRGPRTLRHRGRAVTAADVEDLVMEADPDVARAWALAAGRGEGAAAPGTVGVLVVPRLGGRRPAPTRAMLVGVEDAVREGLGAGVEVWAAGPGWLEVAVSVEVVPADVRAAGGVERDVLAALDRHLDPVLGGEDGRGWAFGRPVLDAELEAVVQRVPGVDHVRDLVVRTVLREPPPVPDAWLAFPGEHHVTMTGGQ